MRQGSRHSVAACEIRLASTLRGHTGAVPPPDSGLYVLRVPTAALTAPPPPLLRPGVPWSEQEHRRFLVGLQKLGKARACPRAGPGLPWATSL